MALSALGYLGVAAGPHAVIAAAGLVVNGAGLGLTVGPLLTRSLAGVRPELAADASGVLTTSVQLGQLTGVAALGAIYLSLLHRATPVHPAADSAVSVVACVMAAISSAAFVLLMCRTGRIRRGRRIRRIRRGRLGHPASRGDRDPAGGGSVPRR